MFRGLWFAGRKCVLTNFHVGSLSVYQRLVWVFWSIFIEIRECCSFETTRWWVKACRPADPRANFTSEGRCWKERTLGKKSYTLFQPKVSTAFGKLSFNFVHKVTRVRTVTQAKKTCTRCSLWASLHLEPVQQKGYHEFRVSCATFQVRTIGMILWQIIMLCNGLPNAERKTLGKGIRQIIQDSRDKKYATCTKAKMRSTILTWQQNYHPFWFLKLVTA